MLKSNWLTDSMALWFLCAFLFCCHFGWLGFFFGLFFVFLFFENWEVLEEVEVEKEYN